MCFTQSRQTGWRYRDENWNRGRLWCGITRRTFFIPRECGWSCWPKLVYNIGLQPIMSTLLTQYYSWNDYLLTILQKATITPKILTYYSSWVIMIEPNYVHNIVRSNQWHLAVNQKIGIYHATNWIKPWLGSQFENS